MNFKASIEIIQTEEHRERKKNLKEMNQTLGTQRTIMKDLTFMSPKFQKERRNYGAKHLKKYWLEMSQIW